MTNTIGTPGGTPPTTTDTSTRDVAKEDRITTQLTPTFERGRI